MMLVTDVSSSDLLKDEHIGHQHHILAYYDVSNRLECHQHVEKYHQHTFLSPTSQNGHRYKFTNITVTVMFPRFYGVRTFTLPVFA